MARLTEDVVATLPDLVEVLLLHYADRWGAGVAVGWGVGKHDRWVRRWWLGWGGCRVAAAQEKSSDVFQVGGWGV